jgi:hypothetical protein
MLGIDNLKIAVLFGINIAEALDKRLEDGKISFIEAITMAGKLRGLPDIISNAAEIKAEFKDLDESERQEIANYVKLELNLNNKNVENIIEKSIDCVASITGVVGEMRSLIGGGAPGQGPTDPDPEPEED